MKKANTLSSLARPAAIFVTGVQQKYLLLAEPLTENLSVQPAKSRYR